jgi:hypothetical protein
MARAKGSTRLIKVPAPQPTVYPTPDGKNWSDEQWTRLKAHLKVNVSIPDAVRQKTLEATRTYVEQASHQTLTTGTVKASVTKWRKETQRLRKEIWSTESDRTSWAGSHTHKPLTLNTIEKEYFRARLRETIKTRVNGRSRQLLAILALGLDIAMTFSDYVEEEIKDTNVGTRTWRLWYVWVALLRAILRENQIPIGNFYGFVLALQATLPESIGKHRAGDSLRKNIRVAQKFSRKSNSRTLLKLLRYWGSFDRVRKSTDRALQKLIDRQDLLVHPKKVLKA